MQFFAVLSAAGFAATASVFAAERPVSFYQDVMPLLSKGGCNAGACHGNANGKGGLKLSLRGENPTADALTLTKDVHGRRVNVEAPEGSLLLRKPARLTDHDGGQRFVPDGSDMATLRQWVTQGAKTDCDTAPKLASLDVSPQESIVEEPVKEVRVTATAAFADGTVRDVTDTAVFEVSNFIAEHRGHGRIFANQHGETTVTVRFLHLQRPVTLAFLPARPDFVWPNPPSTGFIDDLVFAKLRRLKITPSEMCDDAVFLRRVYFDVLGIPPSAAEAKAFIQSDGPSAAKREQLVDSLLRRPEFGEQWALRWSDLLRNEEKVLDARGTEIFFDWLRDWFNEDRPLDAMVRELLTGFGSTYQNPAANYYRALRDPAVRAETTAQVFLGTRLQCAKCHNHPFERWTQDDYYRFGALFDGVDYLVLQNQRRDNLDKHEFAGEQVVHLEGKKEFKDPRSGKPPAPGLLEPNAAPITDQQRRFQQMAAWLSSAEQPLFAKVQANRIWQHLMGVGIVDPVDDFRTTNPPSNPALLDALAAEFVKGGFRLKPLIRSIILSRTYQLSSEPNGANAEDRTNFSHAAIRRLTAEQVVDALHSALGTKPEFTHLPAGTRAGQFPGVRRHLRGAKPSSDEELLQCFGKPSRLIPSETERNNETSLAQVFMLTSGRAVTSLLTSTSNRLNALLDSPGGDLASAITALYWSILNRPPTSSETEYFRAFLNQCPNRREGLEDSAWALLNSKEFILRR